MTVSRDAAATARLPSRRQPGIRHRLALALRGICMGASVRAPCQKTKKRVRSAAVLHAALAPSHWRGVVYPCAVFV